MPGACVSHCVDEQIFQSWHARSCVALDGRVSHWFAWHGDSEAHWRSCVALGARVSYCVAVHVVTSLH